MRRVVDPRRLLRADRSMARAPKPKDFRTKRALLPDSAFALVRGPRLAPTDPVDKPTWGGIMHLPDHVALTTFQADISAARVSPAGSIRRQP